MDALIPPVFASCDTVFNYYRSMRHLRQFHYDSQYCLYSTFRYETVRTVLHDNSLFSSDLLKVTVPRIDPDTIFDSLALKDPPEHSVLRKGIASKFTTRTTNSLLCQLAPYLEMLLEGIEQDREIDVVQQLIRPVVLEMTLILLNIPVSHRNWFASWWRDFTARRNHPKNKQIKRIQYPLREHDKGNPVWDMDIENFLKTLAEKRYVQPENDLISTICAMEYDGQPLTLRQSFNYIRLILVASHDTTTFLLTNALHCVFLHPEIFAAALSSNSMEAFLLETGRLFGPIQGVSRVILKNVNIAGEHLIPGKEVIAWIGSANRDELFFNEADKFILERKEKPLLTYGNGVHYCIGSTLAQGVAAMVLSRLGEFFPNLKPCNQQAYEMCRNPFLFGYERMFCQLR